MNTNEKACNCPNCKRNDGSECWYHSLPSPDPLNRYDEPSRYPDGIANDGYDYANDPTIQRIIGAGYAAGLWASGPQR
jgi:hypothetical protein